MPDLIKSCNETSFGLLSDTGDHGGDGLLTVGVVHHEVVAEIVEDLSVQAGSVRDNQGNVIGPENIREKIKLLSFMVIGTTVTVLIPGQVCYSNGPNVTGC